jgi:uncharacterized protein YrrD
VSILLRGTDLIGLPVVTVDEGEDVAEVKDVVYGTADAGLLGFTLRNRGFLGGPMRQVLPCGDIVAVGRDAVMVPSATVLDEANKEFTELSGDAKGRNVIGTDVLTDAGNRLGEVTDVIVYIDDRPEVVGYEIGKGPLLDERNGAVFIPLPETLAVSGEALMVPAAVQEFVTDDLSGFGASVDAFRAHLRSTS